MWFQVLSFAAVFSAAQGMCFGVPFEQAISCPEPMVYYSQLCICIEPKNRDRLHEIGSIREVPMMAANYPIPSYRDKLHALRHRLTASLPDMSSHRFSSAAPAEMRPHIVVVPDRFFVPTSSFEAMPNHVPRSWKIGGLLEYWPGNEMIGTNTLPVVNTGSLFDPATAGWGAPVQDVGTLSLLERLHSLRNAWRDASLLKSELALEKAALTQSFFKNLPTPGISPDTARSYVHSMHAGAPDSPKELTKVKTQKADPKTSMANLKADAILKLGLSGLMPKEASEQRSNSFLRSAMRLKSATGGGAI